MAKKVQRIKIRVSNDAIKTLVNDTVLNCYGVVKLSRYADESKIKEKVEDESEIKGIRVLRVKNLYLINVYVVLVYGIKITEVLSQIQKSVIYNIKKTFNINVNYVNVYCVGLSEAK